MIGNGLTKRQQEMLDFISAYQKKHGHKPTVREIGAGMKPEIKSPNGVTCHLKALAKKGRIALPENGKARSIRLLDVKTVQIDAEMQKRIENSLEWIGKLRVSKQQVAAFGLLTELLPE